MSQRHLIPLSLVMYVANGDLRVVILYMAFFQEAMKLMSCGD